MKADTDLYRKLPAVDELLRDPGISALVAEQSQAAVVHASRTVLARLRGEIASGNLNEENLPRALSGIASAIEAELRRALGYSLQAVINATGVILHTNLGRAPLAASALEHIRG